MERFNEISKSSLKTASVETPIWEISNVSNFRKMDRLPPTCPEVSLT